MPHQRVEQPKVAKLPAPSRHRSPTLSHRLCAATVTLPPPFLGGRKIDHVHRPRQHVCKRRRCDRIPKVRTWPAPSRHRSPTLSQTVRGPGHTPAAVSRWSKSGHVDHSRHFRASLPTQEPHPHGGTLFLGCATSLSRTTSASTDAATSWVGSTHNGRAQPFTSMPCGRRPRNSRVHHRRRQLLHRPQTASEAAGSALCPSAAHALGLEHTPP